VEWVEKEGGLRKAAKGSNCSDDEGTANAGSDGGESTASAKNDAGKGKSLVQKKLMPNVERLWKRSRDLPAVSGELPLDAFVQSSATLALVIRNLDVDGVQQTRIVPIGADEDFVAKEVQKATQALSSSFREASLIFRLNTFAFAFARAPYFQGEITSNAVVKFQRAFTRLKNNPVWCEKYGLADAEIPSIATSNDGHENNGTAKVVNKEFHEWDPGRFIRGAKPGMLVPQALKGEKDTFSGAARAYVDDFLAWKTRWGKIEKVPNTPFRSSLANLSGGPSNQDAINAGQLEAMQEPEQDAASGDPTLAGSSELAVGNETAPDEVTLDSSSEMDEQNTHDGEGPSEPEADRDEVEAIRITQREPAMSD
jgi:hypothetical protein